MNQKYNEMTQLVSHLLVRCIHCATKITAMDIKIMEDYTLDSGSIVQRVGFFCTKCKSIVYIVEDVKH